MSASVWQPGEASLNVDAESTNLSEVFTVTVGQTVLNLTQFTYTPGTGSIAVYRNGQKLIGTTDYTETDLDTVTLTGISPTAGEVFEVAAIIGSTSANAIAAAASALAAGQAAIDADTARDEAVAAASSINPAAYATAAQGLKADSALQPSDIGGSVQAQLAVASQAEMAAGTEPALRSMSPLRVAQAIAVLAGSGLPDQSGKAGKTLKTNGTVASWDSPVNAGTAINTTSGTAHDFTGIPAWVKRITLTLNKVSTNGASSPLLQIGSGAVSNSGYESTVSSGGVALSATNGFVLNNNFITSSTIVGVIQLVHMGGNVWCVCGISSPSTGAYNQSVCSGVVGLAGTLDRIRLTTVNGTDVFDAGSVNILWE